MMVARLKEDYRERVMPALMKKFSYKNSLQVPRMVKIVVNMGVGEATQDPKLLETAMDDLARITGQKPVVLKSRKSISQFKLRKGVAVGCKVTLRGNRMYEFFDRLVNVAIPRIRDFRGLSPDSFDGRGNYTFGIKEQVMFPEISYDKVKKMFGADLTLVTTARTDEESLELLSQLGMPFRR
jgi:large subunit ribosomal protein L5